MYPHIRVIIHLNAYKYGPLYVHKLLLSAHLLKYLRVHNITRATIVNQNLGDIKMYDHRCYHLGKDIVMKSSNYLRIWNPRIGQR